MCYFQCMQRIQLINYYASFVVDKKYFGTRCCWSSWYLAWLQAWYKAVFFISNSDHARLAILTITKNNHFDSLRTSRLDSNFNLYYMSVKILPSIIFATIWMQITSFKRRPSPSYPLLAFHFIWNLLSSFLWCKELRNILLPNNMDSWTIQFICWRLC